MLRKKIKFKLGKDPTGFLVPGIAVGLLGFLGITALSPMQAPLVSAADEMTLLAFLSPSITLSMSSSVSEDIEPTVDGSFKNIATVARVQVMNSEYYDISISGNPDMVGTANPDSKISAVTGSKKASEFANNTWGYSASKNSAGVTTAVAADSNTAYAAVPSTNTSIVSRQNTTNNAADDYYSLNFGAKVDTSIPADTYTSRVTLSVVASPVLMAQIFDGIETMQELTPEICSRAGIGDTAFLRDTRTNNKDTSSLNKYWVTKLKDGNCWMTQNLDYASTIIMPAESAEKNTSDVGITWDDGLKVMTNPTVFSTVDATTNVSEMTASTEKDFTGSISGNEYNAHYLTGNYYQYSAAQVACPSIGSQWNLPTSNQANLINGSFNKLTDDISSEQFVASPYYFSTTGNLNTNSGSLDNVGIVGMYWSATRNGGYGGSLNLTRTQLNPSQNNLGIYRGLSVRCYVNGTNEFNLIYDANKGTNQGIGEAPVTQTAIDATGVHTFTIAGQGDLTRDGYTFLGWADSVGATEAQYSPGSTVTLQKANPTLILYAVWKDNNLLGVNSMQQLTPTICKSLATGTTMRLKDERDSKYYWVAKLPDGNCWTTQNMDYEISGKSGTAGTLISTDGGYFWENGLKVMNKPDGSATTTINSTWTASTDVDFYTSNGGSAVNSTSKTYDAHYLMGNYYQYSAASTVCTGMGSQWKVPTSNASTSTNGSFNKLVGSNTSDGSWILAKPYFFLRAGYISWDGKGTVNGVGSSGIYWSSSAYSSSDGYARSYILYIDNSVTPASNGHRNAGQSVRCYVDGN